MGEVIDMVKHLITILNRSNPTPTAVSISNSCAQINHIIILKNLGQENRELEEMSVRIRNWFNGSARELGAVGPWKEEFDWLPYDPNSILNFHEFEVENSFSSIDFSERISSEISDQDEVEVHINSGSKIANSCLIKSFSKLAKILYNTREGKLVNLESGEEVENAPLISLKERIYLSSGLVYDVESYGDESLGRELKDLRLEDCKEKLRNKPKETITEGHWLERWVAHVASTHPEVGEVAQGIKFFNPEKYGNSLSPSKSNDYEIDIILQIKDELQTVIFLEVKEATFLKIFTPMRIKLLNERILPARIGTAEGGMTSYSAVVWKPRQKGKKIKFDTICKVLRPSNLLIPDWIQKIKSHQSQISSNKDVIQNQKEFERMVRGAQQRRYIDGIMINKQQFIQKYEPKSINDWKRWKDGINERDLIKEIDGKPLTKDEYYKKYQPGKSTSKWSKWNKAPIWNSKTPIVNNEPPPVNDNSLVDERNNLIANIELEISKNLPELNFQLNWNNRNLKIDLEITIEEGYKFNELEGIFDQIEEKFEQYDLRKLFSWDDELIDKVTKLSTDIFGENVETQFYQKSIVIIHQIITNQDAQNDKSKIEKFSIEIEDILPGFSIIENRKFKITAKNIEFIRTELCKILSGTKKSIFKWDEFLSEILKPHFIKTKSVGTWIKYFKHNNVLPEGWEIQEEYGNNVVKKISG